MASDVLGDLHDSALERQSSSHQAFIRGYERKLAGRKAGHVKNQANCVEEPRASRKDSYVCTLVLTLPSAATGRARTLALTLHVSDTNSHYPDSHHLICEV